MDNFLIAKATDVGVARQVNEDSMTVFASPNGQVMAVCDGMGGQAAGDVASQLAVNIIENILTDNTFDTPEEAIRRSVLAANQGILNRTAQNPELEGMGSTCVMLIVKNGKVHCGWVGDSRIYYISNHTIRQLSHDQSYVQKLVDQGVITPAEALVHPQKNEIENCIGLPGMTAPETIAVPITPEPGSVFLLCSDGLTGMVDNKQIERIISNSSMSLQEKADKLIAMANEAGGLDNITVELLQFGTSDNGGATSGTLFETPNETNKTQKKSRKMLYSALCIIVIAVLAILGVYLYTSQKKKDDPEKTKIEHRGQTSNPASNRTETTPSTSSTPAPQVQTHSTSKPQTTTNPVNPKKKEVKKEVKNIVNNKQKEKENVQLIPQPEQKEGMSQEEIEKVKEGL